VLFTFVIGSIYLWLYFKSRSGLLPICSSCKKICDDKGYWNQLEGYIQKHSEAEFSHGICPECAKSYIRILIFNSKAATVGLIRLV